MINVFSPSWEGRLYHLIYKNISSGNLPHIDFFIEYPPLSVYFITFPISLFKNIDMNLFMKLYIGLVGSWLIIFFGIYYKVLKDFRFDKDKILKYFSFTFLILFILYYVTYARYDIFPAILTSLSLLIYLLYIKDSSKKKFLIISAILLALSFLTKVYAVMLVPIFMMIEFHHKRFRNLFLFLLTLGLLSISNIYFVINGKDNFNKFLDYQGKRDLQIESIYASTYFIGEKLKLLEESNLKHQNGAEEITNKFSKELGKYTTPFIALLSLIIYIFFYNDLKKYKEKNNLEFLLIIYSILLVLIFIIFNKVFSPQYLVWLATLIPLFIFVEDKIYKFKKKLISVILLIGILTLIIFPLNYGQLMEKQTYAIVILSIRNFLLIYLGVIICKVLIKSNQKNLSNEQTSK